MTKGAISGCDPGAGISYKSGFSTYSLVSYASGAGVAAAKIGLKSSAGRISLSFGALPDEGIYRVLSYADVIAS